VLKSLDNVQVFVKVAQFQSISKAAQSLGMPVSTVSRKLSALEGALGVALVRRTTRRVSLTPQGEEFVQRCVEPLSMLEEAEQAVTRSQKRLEGTLKLSVPMFLSQAVFLDFVAKFSRENAEIRLDLYVTNLYLNLVADNIDVAIRIGELHDSSVVARRLGRIVRYLVATPGYLKGRKLPTEPEDLKSHDCVVFNGKNNEAAWDLVSGRRRVRVHVTGSVSSRDCLSSSAFVLRGSGVGLVEAYYCEQPLARGELVRLLPRWTSTPIPVFAVYPSRKFVPSRVRAFIEELSDWKSPLWTR
jgi:DNA-binding transcriptional LysR family regulator